VDNTRSLNEKAAAAAFMMAMSCGVNMFKALPKVESEPYQKTKHDFEREEKAKQKRLKRNAKRLADNS